MHLKVKGYCNIVGGLIKGCFRAKIWYMKNKIIVVLSTFVAVTLFIFVSAYFFGDSPREKLKGYTYIGGLEKVGGRKYEGYYMKDSLVYYVSSDAYGSYVLIDLLVPQPEIGTFRVNNSWLNKESLSASLFAYDSEKLYYTSKQMKGIKPSKFQYLMQEKSNGKSFDYYHYFKNRDVTYKLLGNCDKAYRNVECEPVRVAE